MNKRGRQKVTFRRGGSGWIFSTPEEEGKASVSHGGKRKKVGWRKERFRKCKGRMGRIRPC